MGALKHQLPAPFNSPIELGLRMVFLLQYLRPQAVDLQKLIMLDYALVYSADLDGPSSLHTPVPHRSTEMYTRRGLIQQGLHLMSGKGLVRAEYTVSGISYMGGDRARSMVQGLSAPYFASLRERAEWAVRRYGDWNGEQLTLHFGEQGARWGAEIVDTQGGG
jgi:hypothetical protein